MHFQLKCQQTFFSPTKAQDFFISYPIEQVDSLTYNILIKKINLNATFFETSFIDQFLFQGSTKGILERSSMVEYKPCFKFSLNKNIFLFVTAKICKSEKDTMFFVSVYDVENVKLIHNFEIYLLTKSKINTCVVFNSIGKTLKFYINQSERGKFKGSDTECKKKDCISSYCYYYLISNSELICDKLTLQEGVGIINKGSFRFYENKYTSTILDCSY